MSVSVIIPTYNRAHWIPAAVSSVLRQSVPVEEVIVVDDGSSDDTEAVCSTLAGPIRYIRQENSGVSAARNVGAGVAKSQWLAFLDSDDLWEPTKLEVQLAALADSRAGWSITEMTLVGPDERPVDGTRGLEHAVPVFGEHALSAHEFFGTWLRQTEIECVGARHVLYTGDAFGPLFLGNFVFPSSTVIRRDLFLRTGGFDPAYRCAEDTEFFHRLSAVSPTCVVMTPLLRWRVGHGGRLTANENTVTMIEVALSSNERAQTLRPLSPVEKRAARLGRERLHLRLAYVCLSDLDRHAARKAIRDAWREGAHVSFRSLALFGATLLPGGLLRALGRVKRMLH